MADPENVFRGVQSQHFVKLNPLKKCTALKICKGRLGQKGRGGPLDPPSPSAPVHALQLQRTVESGLSCKMMLPMLVIKSAMAMVIPPFTRVKLMIIRACE